MNAEFQDIVVRNYDLPDAELLSAPEPTGYRIWRPERLYVVLGRANNAGDSLISGNILADDVPVYKRPSGGESVILSPRMVVFSAKIRFSKYMNTSATFRQINILLISRLSELNIKELGSKGISDISIGSRKIAGSSMYLLKESLFYHAVMNIDEDVSLMTRYLQHPKREPDYRKGRPHEEFVTSLSREGYNFKPGEVEEKIELALKEL